VDPGFLDTHNVDAEVVCVQEELHSRCAVTMNTEVTRASIRSDAASQCPYIVAAEIQIKFLIFCNIFFFISRSPPELFGMLFLVFFRDTLIAPSSANQA
jgi:hypothetical protein